MSIPERWTLKDRLDMTDLQACTEIISVIYFEIGGKSTNDFNYDFNKLIVSTKIRINLLWLVPSQSSRLISFSNAVKLIAKLSHNVIFLRILKSDAQIE